MASYQYAFGTTENPISDGGNWTSGPGAFGNINVTGGKARAAVVSQDDAGRVVTAIAANQYAQVLFTTTGGTGTNGRDLGPICRMASTTDGDCYYFDLDPNSPDMAIYRIADTGSIGFTKLGASLSTTVPVSGHTYKLTVNGTTLEAFDNGVSIGTRTDATYATGNPGFMINCQNVTVGELDDFDGGDLAGAQDTPELAGRPFGQRGESLMQQLLAQ